MASSGPVSSSELSSKEFSRKVRQKIASVGLTERERGALERLLAANEALSDRLRRPISASKAPDSLKTTDRPLNRSRVKQSQRRPAGSECRGCREKLPHVTKDDWYWHFHLMAIRRRAFFQWAKMSPAERRVQTTPGMHESRRKNLKIRISQARMWLLPEVSKRMSDEMVIKIVLDYQKSTSTRFRPWLRVHYPTIDGPLDPHMAKMIEKAAFLRRQRRGNGA
jgi:hypothetical protein